MPSNRKVERRKGQKDKRRKEEKYKRGKEEKEKRRIEVKKNRGKKKRRKEEKRKENRERINIRKGRLVPTSLVRLKPQKPNPIGAPENQENSNINSCQIKRLSLFGGSYHLRSLKFLL